MSSRAKEPHFSPGIELRRLLLAGTPTTAEPQKSKIHIGEIPGNATLSRDIPREQILSYLRPMYAYLKGEITFRSPAFITLEVNGTGFHVNIPLSTYTAIEGQERATIYTHLHPNTSKNTQ